MTAAGVGWARDIAGNPNATLGAEDRRIIAETDQAVKKALRVE